MENFFLVTDEYINSRLDRWIRRNICSVPQSLIEKNIRKGKIKVNYKKEKSSYKLKKNDKITIHNVNFTPSTNIRNISNYIATKKEISSTSNIILEDNENFSVINKPAGIAVQSGTKSKKNIIDILRYTKEFKKTSPYTVHRIDKETSGLLLVAKNRKYAQLLTSLFRIRKIHKTYLCIVVGEFTKNKGTFVDNLIHHEGKNKIKSKAITHFTVLDSNNNYTLLKLNPLTGRKHQLRKQLLLHGYPILGDSKYRLSSSKNKKDALMLHAYKINFSVSDIRYNFLAEPPKNFIDMLKKKYLKNSLQ